MQSSWIKTNEDLPPFGTEVLGYHPTWIDDDFNPEGVRVCYLQEQLDEPDLWCIAIWDNDMDNWCNYTQLEKRYDEQVAAPSHWMQKPTPPKN